MNIIRNVMGGGDSSDTTTGAAVFASTIPSSHLAVTGPLRTPLPHLHLNHHIELVTPEPISIFPSNKIHPTLCPFTVIQFINSSSATAAYLVVPPSSSFSYPPPQKLETGLQRLFVLQYPLLSLSLSKNRHPGIREAPRNTVWCVRARVHACKEVGRGMRETGFFFCGSV